MNTQKLFQLLSYFHIHGIERVRIMGGEPTLHPDFGEIVKVCQKYFKRVTVFTNGTNPALKTFNPRSMDGINYNSSYIEELSPDMMLKDKSGARTISAVLNANTDINRVFRNIKRCSSFFPNTKVSLTFDCTANIFKDRKVLIDKYHQLNDLCFKESIESIIDHALPICFLYESGIAVPSNFSICNNNCAGLVDAEFNMRFCNQCTGSFLPLYEGDKIIPFKIIENFFLRAYYDKQAKALKKICQSCTLYGEYCNGGCYITNSNISKDDIINNTDLPIKTN